MTLFRQTTTAKYKKMARQLEKLLREIADWQLLYGTDKEGLAKAWQNTEKAIMDWRKRAAELIRAFEIEESKK